MKYFSNEDCSTPEKLKTVFKKLCLKMHPDKGGNAEEFKEMLNEFKSVRSDNLFDDRDLGLNEWFSDWMNKYQDEINELWEKMKHDITFDNKEYYKGEKFVKVEIVRGKRKK